jgi:hypothetical protein
MTMQGWADAQKKFERIAEIVAVIAIEAIWSTVEGKLCAESNINAVAMR